MCRFRAFADGTWNVPAALQVKSVPLDVSPQVPSSQSRGANAAPLTGLNKVRVRYRSDCGFVAIPISRHRRDSILRSDLRDRHHRAARLTRRVAFRKRSTICGLCSDGDGSEGEFRSGAG